MKLQAEIFSQGHELIIGQTVDSNAAWLAEQLSELGFALTRHTTVGDDLAGLVAVINEIAARADVCICTGGLGPTSDDLTAQAVSIATAQPLVFDAIALMAIQAFFDKRARIMPEANRKQAYLPEQSHRLDNAHGTAPGFALQYQRCWFVFLPGVPMEMKQMFQYQVKQKLASMFSLQPSHLVTLRTVGQGESALQQQLMPVTLPDQVQLGFRAMLGEVQIKLTFPYAYPEADKQALVSELAKLIGEPVFAIEGLAAEAGDLAQVVARLLQAKGYTLAILETLSLGLLAAKCAGWQGIKSLKIALNAEQLIAQTGLNLAPERLIAELDNIALALKQQADSDLALVQFYYPANDEKQTLLYNALCGAENQVRLSQYVLTGTPGQIQQQSATLSLDCLRWYLQNG